MCPWDAISFLGRRGKPWESLNQNACGFWKQCRLPRPGGRCRYPPRESEINTPLLHVILPLMLVLPIASVTKAQSKNEPPSVDETIANQTEAEPAAKAHGLIGLRPIPADQAGTKHNHGGSWKGMPTYDKQKGNYPFVAKQIDTLFGWVPDGDYDNTSNRQPQPARLIANDCH